jgi:hypothetical protein
MPDEDPFVGALEGYSLVVTGNMNPAIHHPFWYKEIGALTQAEFEETGASSSWAAASLGSAKPGVTQLALPFISSSMLSQFTSGKIRIICIPQSYTITTFDRTLLPRIREVASLVFQVLTHTRISAYGFNFNVHRETGIGNVGELLAQILDSTQFSELMKNTREGRTAKIAYTFSDQGRALNISAEQSRHAPNMVFVGVNAHHSIGPSKEFKQFDLTPLLQESMRKDASDAEQVISKIMDILKGSGES